MSETTMRRNGADAGLGTRLSSLAMEKIGLAFLRAPQYGALTFTLPSGRQRRIGDPKTGPSADLTLRNFNVVGQAMRRGTVGFAAAYMDGDIDTTDLLAVFEFFLANRAALSRPTPGFFDRAARDLAYHVGRRNTREGSKQNIAEHYDLGNDFYREWLDPSMTYSSACFADETMGLEAAQRHKYEKVAQAVGLGDGHSILEVGCGWGGFAQAALTERDANLYGITLSHEQLAYGRERLAAANLSDRAELVYEDYRDVTGQFDHVVSIEMIEAVGEEHWPGYFQTVHDRLKPGGTAAIQAITIDDAEFETYRAGPDFIQRYIFPGGMLLTKTAMREQAQRAGLVFEGAENFRLSYAKTLRAWRERFLARWPHIAKLGYSETFKRKWLYYLTYCEAGFRDGMIDVGIYRYSRPA